MVFFGVNDERDDILLSVERTSWKMSPTGRFLVCLVLVLSGTLSKSVPSKEEALENWRNVTGERVTKLVPVYDASNSNFTEDLDIAALRTFLDDFFAVGSEDQGTGVQEGRTFGHKRIQFMLLPMMYKMGVMMTLLGILTVISLKGLLVGVILLVMKLSSFFAKFHTWKPHADYGQNWAGPQPVHVHVHNDGGHHAHSQAYSNWDLASGPGDDEHYYYKG